MPITSRVVHEDAEIGYTQIMHVDEETGDVRLEDKQDVTALVELNKALSNAESSDWKGEMHRVASIPLSVYYDLQRRGIIDDPVALKKWLNDSDNRFFRTRPGRV